MTTTERLTFTGSLGHPLAARLEQPDAEPRAYALFAHCFTCSMDLKAIHTISGTLADAGIAVLRFDFTGLGESEGEFADTDFSSNLDDLELAAGFLRERYSAPCLLIGHSLGGTAALAVAHRIGEVRAVATIGSPSDTRHLSDALRTQAPELEQRGEAEIQLTGRPFRIKRSLIDDLDEARVTPRIAQLGRALMIFHSPADETVSVDHARRVYAAASHPKSFVSLDKADHLLLADRSHAKWLANVLAAWVEPYLSR